MTEVGSLIKRGGITASVRQEKNIKNILTVGISLNKYQDGAVWNLVAPTWRLNAPRVNKLVFNHAKLKEGRRASLLSRTLLAFVPVHASVNLRPEPKGDKGRRTKAKKGLPTRSFMFFRSQPARSQN